MAAEVCTLVVFYQVKGNHALALVGAYHWLRETLMRWRVEQQAPYRALYSEARKRLQEDSGRELRGELEARYAEQFGRFVRAVRDAGSKLLVLDFLSEPESLHGMLIARLVADHGVDHLDLSEAMRAIPAQHRLLLPADGHFTRYANHYVADALARRLDAYAGHDCGHDYTGTPRLLGDVPARFGDPSGAQRKRILNMRGDLGFCLVVNAQGFRNTHDLEIPKRRQRVLCLGDSYTFGDHINNQDTYPAIVGRLRPQLEVINGGVSGYTITDQLEFFESRACLAAPDVVVLQVCENDLVELTATIRNRQARSGQGSYRPGPAEKRFMAEVRRALGQ